MKSLAPSASKTVTKFRMPTAENLVPIRLDIEIDGQRFKDSFTWNPNGKYYVDAGYTGMPCYLMPYKGEMSRPVICTNQKRLISTNHGDPDSEVVNFAKRTVKDLKLPPAFITQIAQSIQSQLAEFRSFEGQEMHTKEKIVPLKLDLRVNNIVIRDQFLWDISNYESDPEDFARTFCKDLEIRDPEVGPAIAVAIREQLYELAVQSVSSARETRVGKKGRRGAENITNIKAGNSALDLYKLFGSKGSVVRKKKEWYLYEPIIDILSNEEVEALDAREERNARLKRKLDDKEDSFQTHYSHG